MKRLLRTNTIFHPYLSTQLFLQIYFSPLKLSTCNNGNTSHRNKNTHSLCNKETYIRTDYLQSLTNVHQRTRNARDTSKMKLKTPFFSWLISNRSLGSYRNKKNIYIKKPFYLRNENTPLRHYAQLYCVLHITWSAYFYT